MKKLFFIIMTAASITGTGQNHMIGIKGGVSRTNVTTSDFMSNNDFRTSLTPGLTYDYFFGKIFSVGTEFIYSQRGFTNNNILNEYVDNPKGAEGTFEYNYDYISIPLAVGYNYGKTVFCFAKLGLTPSFLVKAETITPTFHYGETIIQSETYNIKGKVNNFDIGGLAEVGGGYKFIKGYWLFASISYQHSFTTITNSGYYGNSQIKHYGITLNIGLKYSL